MSEESSKKLSNLEYLSTAAIAKFAASVSTYPHEVQQMEYAAFDAEDTLIGYPNSHEGERSKRGEEEALGLCTTVTYPDRGLYGGLFMHLLRVVPNTAILFFTYEKVSVSCPDDQGIF
eukprot:754507-Hanusia_phi.AAC.2